MLFAGLAACVWLASRDAYGPNAMFDTVLYRTLK